MTRENDSVQPLEQWLIQEEKQKHGAHDPTPRGVSFTEVNVNGYTETHAFQHTFASYIQLIPSKLKGLVGFPVPRRKVQILRDLDGLVQPGEMLLVLGRPGSGCTTFLKTMSGYVNGVEVEEKGKGKGIMYDEIPFREMHQKYWADTIYLAEDDIHLPELTLEETLTFAAEMRPHAQSTETVSHQIASIYGMQRSLNTQVGNDLIRGLSGGEKRRTSIAEAFLSRCPIQCCDNSIRGLDSATALNVVRTLRRMADVRKSTIMTTIYQTPESLYSQFDKVLLLYLGRQIYFGPATEAADYFQRLGFVRPERATTADFLTSLTNPVERMVRPEHAASLPRTPDDLARAWRDSPEYLALRKEITEYNTKHSSQSCSASSFYPTSIMHQFQACFRRALIRSRHNLQGIVSGVVGNVIVSIILGSLFYNLKDDTDSFETRSILIFYATMMNSCLPAFEVITLWGQRTTVEKHSRYAFYHPVAEGVASMLSDLPVKALTSFGFNVAVYFLTNLRREVGAFFIFWLFGLVVMVTMSMIFRSVGSISRTYDQSLAPVSIVIFNFIIYAGFVIPPSDQVPWLSWIRYFNPIAYANESLMINEFQKRRFSCSSFVPSGPSYPDSLDEKTCSAIGSVAGQSWVDGNQYLQLKYGYLVEHLWRNLGILFALMVGFCAVYLVATEYIQAQRSKGDILLFRRKDAISHAALPDEESVEFDSLHIREKGTPDLRVPEQGDMPNSLGKQSSVFLWSDVGYDIKADKKEETRILEGIDGWVVRGTLTALMGSTGAGKTTLLDVLANRKYTGTVHGEVRIDGRARDGYFQRKTGYVQQADIHCPSATVREALEFSALLRQPRELARSEKLAYVDTVLQMLEMEAYADAIVGVPGKGLNIEQRKRLTIAVEMAARPELLFLDEPTSGLDSQTAWSICTLLRKLSDNGQPILCTIHQPSSELFEMFDRLLFLQAGKTVYFGDLGRSASTVIDYFTRSGARIPALGENPAEWLLEVTGTSPPKGTEDWRTVWETSQEAETSKTEIAAMKRNACSTSAAVTEDYEYAASALTQLWVVTYRMFQDYWREPNYLYSKLALCIGSALFNGLSFWMLDHTVQGLTSSIFSCFLISIIFNTVDQQIIPRFIDNREIFEARERQSKTYSWPIFVAANMIVELVWQSLTAVPVFVAWYYPTGFWRSGLNATSDAIGMNERAGLTFLIIWLFLAFTSTFSQALAAGMPDSLTAVNIANLMFMLCLIFCGILVQPNAMPSFWLFMYRVSPMTYIMGGMIKAGLADTPLNCASIDLLRIPLPTQNGTTVSCGSYLAKYVSMAGGRVLNAETAVSGEDCLFCAVTDTNTTLQGMHIDVRTRWRDLGLLAVFVVVNIFGVFFFYWVTKGRNRRDGKEERS
ncbi:uncharacterized protein N7484_001873 [Penicillium longicatenatum]|uniref:uncharacterized protein n=1 Tax=Penicillium longicatenatum TaxID=1561947 RepID=UPI002547B134|nr:uncharacterized protein N7484_001873 [Penicillium longicatenatum]KAJ5658224.1 hypothetical protein N7484_001873 [Penicillium longicatenatum]